MEISAKSENKARKDLRKRQELGGLIHKQQEEREGDALVTTPMGSRLGFENGFLILEVGYSSDCDEALRGQIETITGNQLLSGEVHEVVDAVIIWWRDDDGDLVDELVDGLTYLADTGQIWVFTPKVGRPGHVEPSDIQDAAPTAGLSQTSSLSIAPDWSATRLVARKSSKR